MLNSQKKFRQNIDLTSKMYTEIQNGNFELLKE